jgi:hypothetical protein
LLINGPKGQSFAEIEVEDDGVTIHPAMADCALAHALNLYNELPEVNYAEVPRKETQG